MSRTPPFIKTTIPCLDNPDWTTSLVDVGSKGVDRDWVIKSAAANIFAGYTPPKKKGVAYVHAVALGDTDVYGMNRNGDHFFKQARAFHVPNPMAGESPDLWINCGNKERAHTFEKFAKVYRHHKHDKGDPVFGDVIKSAHNDATSRVEVILELPVDEWGDQLEKAANGKPIPLSMSARIPFDYCSNCKHRAPTPEDYCDCLQYGLGQITKSGHAIGAINDWHTFFDVSEVIVGADRIAWGLVKAAGLREFGQGMSGSELSKALNILTPLEISNLDPYSLDTGPTARVHGMLAKLAAMEKEIEMGDAAELANGLPDGDEAGEGLDKLLSGTPRSEIPALLGSLADAKIVLSLEDFVKLVLGVETPRLGAKLVQARSFLPGVFGRLSGSDDLPGILFDDTQFSDGPIGMDGEELIRRITPHMSLDDQPVRRRVVVSVVKRTTPKLMTSLPEDAEKEASFAGPKELAELYGGYQAAAVLRAGETPLLTKLVVLSNYAEVT